MKFNHLTVIKRGEDLIKKNGKKEFRWICSCDCGNPNTVLVLGYNLKNGNTTSCGCEHLKNAVKQGKKNGPIIGKNNKKYNRYDLSGSFGVGYTSKNEEFYFDLEDYDMIKDICWYKDEHGYIVNKTDDGLILMHRLIMGLQKGEDIEVDHIYHIVHDNRKSQLRLVTSGQNKMNSSIAKNNTSGTKGVYYDKKTKKWAAYIGIEGYRLHLGQYPTEEDAINRRKHVEEIVFGEYMFREKEGD